MESNIQSKIAAEIKLSMKAKDKEKLEIMRTISSEFKLHCINNRIVGVIEDSNAIMILKKMAKQRKEAAKQYAEAKRLDLEEKEKYQISVISQFLPRQMSTSETTTVIEEIMSVNKLEDMSQLPQLMKEVKLRYPDNIDMALVSSIAREKLQK